jgi:hypothetical protein
MNKRIINIFLAVTLVLGLTSCNDMLDESPKSKLTPDFLNSTLGLQSGIIAAYSNMKWIIGGDGPDAWSIIGTDEFSSTDQLGSATAFDDYSSIASGNAPGYWGQCLQNINTCNGVIDYGTVSNAPGLTPAIKKQTLAEAHFLRGFYYYILTMNYGAAPLDLGSGKLKFNLQPVTTSVRDSRAAVLDAVIADFTYAKDSLPVKPTVGRAAQGAALHFLAKAYLSKASLGLGDVAAGYTAAYNTAMTLINNQSTYGAALTTDFANVNLEGHENDPEALFNVQRTWTASGPNLQFEESNDGTYAVGNKGNRLNFFFTAGYENVKWGGNAVVPRVILYQRPWRMFIPTAWLVKTAFADKVNDSRWDGSFRTAWIAQAKFPTAIKGRFINAGDTAIKVSLNAVETPAPADTVVGGVIWKPYALYYWGMLYNADGTFKNGAVQYMYPSLKKFDDTKRPNMNYDSNRPVILAKLSETYLIAAEAVMSTDKTEAARLINVVRERAAYRPGLSASTLTTRKAAMDIAPAQVTIDFILDERTRELCGETWRWIDLVRTGKLLDRVKSHNLKGAKNIVDKHLLRPIPQAQIDFLSDPSQKASYQNPGY